MISQKGTNAFWKAVNVVKDYVEFNIYFLESTY